MGLSPKLSLALGNRGAAFFSRPQTIFTTQFRSIIRTFTLELHGASWSFMELHDASWSFKELHLLHPLFLLPPIHKFSIRELIHFIFSGA